MELVERYIYAVVKNLPAKSRKDIENELRSLIMDALDARVAGKTPTELDITEVLKELGAPAKVAQNYFKEGSYLIGPRFYDLYMLIVKIASGAAAFGITVAFIVQAFQNDIVVIDIIHLMGQLISAIFSAVGFVTIAFVITERINPDFGKNALDIDKCWNPKDLPIVPQQFEKVKTSELIVGLFFAGLFFILLNFYPKTFGFYHAEGHEYIPLIQLDVLRQYLPFMNILIGMGFINMFLLLVDGKYKFYTFILEIIGTLGSIALAVWMLSGPILLNVSTIVDIVNQDTLYKVLNGVYRGILILTIVGGIFELFRYGYRFIRSIIAR